MLIRKSKSGFTLVELLVVISIIGILSSFAIVSLNTARIKARDALRKGDMAQLRTALVLYYDDNLAYPICNNWDEGEADLGASVANGAPCYNSVLEPALTAGTRPIMGNAPKDPKNPDNVDLAGGGSDIYIYRYVSDANGSQYAIVYTLEDGSEQLMRGW